MLDSGLFGGFTMERMGAESVLLRDCDSGAPAQLDRAREGPGVTLLCSLLVMGGLTWSVHADC